MDTKKLATGSFLLGVLLSVVTVFFELGDWATQILIILGIIVGFFHPWRDELLTLGITYLALSLAAGSMSELIGVGGMISDVANAWVRFLGPVVLTAFMVWGSARLITLKQKEAN